MKGNNTTTVWGVKGSTGNRSTNSLIADIAPLCTLVEFLNTKTACALLALVACVQWAPTIIAAISRS